MPRWISKDVQVVLPAELVHAMFHAAERYDVDEGGRFDRRGAAIIIWSASFTAGEERSEPQGEAYFSWRTPTDTQVTLYTIGWAPDEGGSELMVWEALEVLAGRPVRP